MGIFGNEVHSEVQFVGEDVPVYKETWHGQSGFDAMGHVVPMFRRAAAENHLKSMGFTDAEKRFSIVSLMSNYIERDNSWQALEQGHKNGLDVTGCYVILSVLLTAEEPTTE